MQIKKLHVELLIGLVLLLIAFVFFWLAYNSPSHLFALPSGDALYGSLVYVWGFFIGIIKLISTMVWSVFSRNPVVISILIILFLSLYSLKRIYIRKN